MHHHNNKSRTLHPRRLPALLGLMTLGSLALQPAAADFLSNSDLDLKLRNEYRHADRPSASPPYGPKIDAWVQGFLFDYKSGKIADKVGIEASLHRVQKLSADPDASTRFYLDGHDSFTLPAAALTLDLADWAQFKIGRFITDYRYESAGFDNVVPLITGASVRVVPEMDEGALWRGDFGPLSLYAKYSRAFAGGYYTKWTDSTVSYFDDLNDDHALMVTTDHPEYSFAGTWSTDQGVYSLGMQYQEDHSRQYMARTKRSWELEGGDHLRARGIGFFAETIGKTRDSFLENETYVASGELTYTRDSNTFRAAIGRVGPKLPGIVRIDTDLVFPFDMSIDRNHSDMFSWQLGAHHRFQKNTTAGLEIVGTKGHETTKNNVDVEGLGLNFIISHRVNSGPLNGLRFLGILNKAIEDREGGTVTDDLDYYDIKLVTTYDIDIF